MGVIDGQAVDAAVTNPAFINKNVNDVMPNKLGFNRPMSGASIADIQQAVNNLYTATGVSETQSGTNYNSTPNTINNGDSYLVALRKLANKFDAVTGHEHTGASGDGPMILMTSGISSEGVHRGLVAAADGMGGMTFVSVTGGGSSSGTGGTFSQQSVTGAVVEIPPSAGFGFVLMALDSNSANMNWCIGATAGAATGMQLEPGRDTGFVPCAANISICPATGLQTYALQWLTQ